MPARIDELLNQRLSQLPAADGGPDGWRAVQDKLRRRRASVANVERAARWSMAASVVVIASVLAFGVSQRTGRLVAPTAVATPPASSPLEQLRAESVALEQVLDALPERPAVARAGTALPIDTLEAQVQWLDHQLSAGDALGQPADEEQLWRQRVEVMSSLVRLRYAEAQQLAM